jgi:hypothetical protein
MIGTQKPSVVNRGHFTRAYESLHSNSTYSKGQRENAY